MKSERMKTELDHQCFHDPKTPLTAIITYVDLLKSEEDPRNVREYLEVLERKSLRLKVLIEDLFGDQQSHKQKCDDEFYESGHWGLLKQVGLECDRKIKEADLDFRWNLPKRKWYSYWTARKPIVSLKPDCEHHEIRACRIRASISILSSRRMVLTGHL